MVEEREERCGQFGERIWVLGVQRGGGGGGHGGSCNNKVGRNLDGVEKGVRIQGCSRRGRKQGIEEGWGLGWWWQ